MTRAVWIDNGSDPNYAKLGEYGITVPYFDPRDERVTASYLAGVAAHAGIATCGLYFAWNWYTQRPAAELAQTISDDVRRVGWPGNPPVCIDIEKGHGLDDSNYVRYVLDFFKAWRALRPKRETAYTLEGFQGGLFSPVAVIGIASYGLTICPQMYDGAMRPLAHDVTLDLLIQGFRDVQLAGMYDAAALPYNWRGFAFTQGRLP